MKKEIFKFEYNNEEYNASYWWNCYATNYITNVVCEECESVYEYEFEYEYEVYIDFNKRTALLVDIDTNKVLTTTPLSDIDIDLLTEYEEHNMDDVYDHILERFEANLLEMGLNYILEDLD